MEIDDDGEAGFGGGGGGGVEAEPEVAGRVDCDIKAFDSIDGSFGGRGFDAEEVYETTVDGTV